jgi:hypothetical protein
MGINAQKLRHDSLGYNESGSNPIGYEPQTDSQVATMRGKISTRLKCPPVKHSPWLRSALRLDLEGKSLNLTVYYTYLRKSHKK